MGKGFKQHDPQRPYDQRHLEAHSHTFTHSHMNNSAQLIRLRAYFGDAEGNRREPAENPHSDGENTRTFTLTITRAQDPGAAAPLSTATLCHKVLQRCPEILAPFVRMRKT